MTKYLLNGGGIRMKEYIIARLEKDCEYFCMSCGQLRLSVGNRDPDNCGNCGSPKLIVGEVGCLDKEELKRRYNTYDPTT